MTTSCCGASRLRDGSSKTGRKNTTSVRIACERVRCHCCRRFGRIAWSGTTCLYASVVQPLQQYMGRNTRGIIHTMIAREHDIRTQIFVYVCCCIAAPMAILGLIHCTGTVGQWPGRQRKQHRWAILRFRDSVPYFHAPTTIYAKVHQPLGPI
jgi:hypothetical protein